MAAEPQPTVYVLDDEPDMCESISLLLDAAGIPRRTFTEPQELLDAVRRMARVKPVVVSMGTVAASGGYFVSMAADRIVAQPGTITGSIGVIFSVSNLEGLMKKVGVKTDAIKSGKFKDIGSMSREMTSEERKLLQDMIDDSYEQFVAAVSAGRRMPVEKVKELADGRIYTGRQASMNGLVDKLGDLQEALDAAGELAKIGKNPKVLTDSDPFESLFSLMDTKLSLFGSKALSEAVDASPSLEYRWYGH